MQHDYQKHLYMYGVHLRRYILSSQIKKPTSYDEVKSRNVACLDSLTQYALLFVLSCEWLAKCLHHMCKIKYLDSFVQSINSNQIFDLVRELSLEINKVHVKKNLQLLTAKQVNDNIAICLMLLA